jgi:thiamine pyrophosphokinase
MRIAIIANGEWDSVWGRTKLREEKFDLLICADGGANLALAAGIVPDVLIGDLDSATQDTISKCEENKVRIIKYPSEKDETDLELAVNYAHSYMKGQPEKEILLYAAGGKRLDHLLGNIAIMLGSAQKGLKFIMVDKDYRAWVMLPGRDTIAGAKGQSLSIIPLSEKAEVNTHGLYYELNNLVLWQNSTRGISNVFEQTEIKLEVLQGCVLIMQSF